MRKELEKLLQEAKQLAQQEKWQQEHDKYTEFLDSLSPAEKQQEIQAIVNAYCNRGTAKNALGDYECAIADFDKALRIDPDNTHAIHNRAVVLSLQSSEKEPQELNRKLEENIKNTIDCGDCVDWLKKARPSSVDLSFLDPPFNQGKKYRKFDDKRDDADYWQWMTDILQLMRRMTVAGGWVYFMQREKNTEFVLRALRESGWTFKNLIVWKKKTSAVPCSHKFGLNYQIIAAAVNGDSPRVFNRLRISPPLPSGYKPRENGIYVTDVWDDIRELTAGYFAGTEAIRDDNGERFHKQQAPLALLTRIILSASRPGDVVFDPFSGTGTTSVAASLLGRKGISIEIDPLNAECIRSRIFAPRQSDIECMDKLYKSYMCTENLDSIWGGDIPNKSHSSVVEKIPSQLSLTI